MAKGIYVGICMFFIFVVDIEIYWNGTYMFWGFISRFDMVNEFLLDCLKNIVIRDDHAII